MQNQHLTIMYTIYTPHNREYYSVLYDILHAIENMKTRMHMKIHISHGYTAWCTYSNILL